MLPEEIGQNFDGEDPLLRRLRERLDRIKAGFADLGTALQLHHAVAELSEPSDEELAELCLEREGKLFD